MKNKFLGAMLCAVCALYLISFFKGDWVCSARKTDECLATAAPGGTELCSANEIYEGRVEVSAINLDVSEVSSEADPSHEAVDSENSLRDSNTESYAVSALSEDVQVGSRILELIFGKRSDKPKTVALGGDVFGVTLQQSYVSVADAKGLPALSRGDVILSINGEPVHSAGDARQVVCASGGESLTIRARHKGKEIALEVRPKLIDGEYKLGIALRDRAMGIGTVTYFDPESGAFGGLGHGICDSDTGEIIGMNSGVVTGALLGGIHKGESGKPGELTGILTDESIGTLKSNNECGVFGVLTKIPENYTLVEIADRDSVCEGEATIISTLKNGKTDEYKIQIYDINRDSDGSKSFRIKITDEVLKALTGGVVRGMSGSPIIQNGKLVGAVTHVMVADPTEGYGIFIENMLNAAQGEVQPKAA